MAAPACRVAVVGATGAVGSEVLEAFERRSLPVGELRAFASEASYGEAVELQGETVEVETGEPRLGGCDAVFLCAPPAESLDAARVALRASVPVIDLSGALAGRSEVPLLLAETADAATLQAPAISALSGTALAWTRVLRPLHETAPLGRVIGTALEAASGGGRAGVDALSSESIALFNQNEAPESEAFGHPVAFDSVPLCGDPVAGGASDREEALVAALRRTLGEDVAVSVTAVRVPVFCGDGAALWLAPAGDAALDPDEAVAALRKAEGVSVWPDPGPALSARSAAGLNQVLAGRVRRDPAGGLQLWLAADLPRLSADHAVALFEARSARQ